MSPKGTESGGDDSLQHRHPVGPNYRFSQSLESHTSAPTEQQRRSHEGDRGSHPWPGGQPCLLVSPPSLQGLRKLPSTPQTCLGPRPSPSCAPCSERAPGIWWLHFSQKKDADETDSYHCFLKVARMTSADSKHSRTARACSRCGTGTPTGVPTAPHGCLTGLQDGGASPAGPHGGKGPGVQAV